MNKLIIGILSIGLCLGAQAEWNVSESIDVMTDEKSSYAISPEYAPINKMSFPYGDIKAYLGFGCKNETEWMYVGFTGNINLDYEDSWFSTKVKWGKSLSEIYLIESSSQTSVHFQGDHHHNQMRHIITNDVMILELNWYGQGKVHFKFPLDNAVEYINKARSNCGLELFDINRKGWVYERDEEKEEGFGAYAVSGFTPSLNPMDEPYNNTKSYLKYSCGSKLAYSNEKHETLEKYETLSFRFINGFPKINGTEKELSKSWIKFVYNSDISLGDKSYVVELGQDENRDSIYIYNDEGNLFLMNGDFINKMIKENSMKVKFDFREIGEVYFDYDLTDAKHVIERARKICEFGK